MGYQIITAIDCIKNETGSQIPFLCVTENNFWDNNLILEVKQNPEKNSRLFPILPKMFPNDAENKILILLNIYFSNNVVKIFEDNFSRYVKIDSIGWISNFIFILQEKLSLKNEGNDFEDEIKNSIKESIKDTNNYFKHKFINYFGEKESTTKKNSTHPNLDHINVSLILNYLVILSLFFGGIYGEKIENELENEIDVDSIFNLSLNMGFSKIKKFKNIDKNLFVVSITEKLILTKIFFTDSKFALKISQSLTLFYKNSGDLYELFTILQFFNLFNGKKSFFLTIQKKYPFLRTKINKFNPTLIYGINDDIDIFNCLINSKYTGTIIRTKDCIKGLNFNNNSNIKRTLQSVDGFINLLKKNFEEEKEEKKKTNKN
jgi:hypothetical protein